MAEEEPTVRVTLTTVFNELRSLTETVNSLNERLPNHVDQTTKEMADIRKDVADHEKRLRQVESRLWIAVGGFGLIAAASPYLSRVFIP